MEKEYDQSAKESPMEYFRGIKAFQLFYYQECSLENKGSAHEFYYLLYVVFFYQLGSLDL